MVFKTGIISSWKDEKGFGFITPNSGGDNVFFHISKYSDRHRRPFPGLSVNYRLTKDSRGRLNAINVVPETGHKEVSKADNQKVFSVLISSVFICIVGGLVLFGTLPPIILGLYIAASVFTFGLYAQDKAAARTGKWRTAEDTLHLFSLVGGWPGAAIAQSHLRHKSKKPSFRAVYWLTVIINCGILCWLLTTEGSYQLENILRNIGFG